MWQRVRIEFEFESRNFRKHKHRSDRCDVMCAGGTIGRSVRWMWWSWGFSPQMSADERRSGRTGTGKIERNESTLYLHNKKYKVPQAYLRADDCARKLYGLRDDVCQKRSREPTNRNRRQRPALLLSQTKKEAAFFCGLFKPSVNHKSDKPYKPITGTVAVTLRPMNRRTWPGALRRRRR
jgi:hypothetical protein